MSLNGLDASAVKLAYETAVTEPGGWLLLKYKSRDEIELHSHGSGGIVEIRNAISQFEDASPLYGMLRYRRRNVVIKYLPDNCSRLIQARVAVHFNAVSDKFTPHNATFTISTASELKDTRLSAACSLRTASSSTSSSTSSLRRRRLIEIVEEEEEELQASKRQSTSKIKGRSDDDYHPPSTLFVLNSELTESPEAPQFSFSNNPPPFLGSESPRSPSKLPDTGPLSSPLSHEDISSHTLRSFGKPRVKIGPRPSVDNGGRPRTSASTGGFRPVSSIPAGFKVLSKSSRRERDSDKSTVTVESSSGLQIDDIKKVDLKNEDSGNDVVVVETIQVPGTSTFVPATAEDVRDKQLIIFNERPNTSSGVSVKSASANATTSTKRNTITPEMIRLKRAIKLREKRKNFTDQLPTLNQDQNTVSNLDSVNTSHVVWQPQTSTSPNLSVDDLTKTIGFRDNQSADQSVARRENFADSAIAIEHLSFDYASSAHILSESELHSVSPSALLSENCNSMNVLFLSDSTAERAQAHLACDRTAIDGLYEKLKDPVLPDLPPIVSEPAPGDDSKASNLEGNASIAAVKQIRSKRASESMGIHDSCKFEQDIACSHVNLSDDDDLMDELQSATLQEAKPVLVSKSPIASVFPSIAPSRQPQLGFQQDVLTTSACRTVSNPVRGALTAPKEARPGSSRSVSSGAVSSGVMFMHKIATDASSTLTSKKTNIGSSISQRIKALEKLSEGARTTTSEALTRPSSAFFSVRKTSGQESSASHVLVDRTSPQAKDVFPSQLVSNELPLKVQKLTARRDRSGSIANRLSVFEPANMLVGRPESIQVKARILRDPAQLFPKMAEGYSELAELSSLNLTESPLDIDHTTAVRTSPFLLASREASEINTKNESIQERRMSREKKRSQSHDGSVSDDIVGLGTLFTRRRSSLSIVKDFIKERRDSVMGGRSTSSDNISGLISDMSLPTPSKSPSRPPSVHTTSGLARCLSISSRRSSISKDKDLNSGHGVPLSPSPMTETSGSGDESRPSTSGFPHKIPGSGSGKSRAGRFMRRLSSSFSSSRRTATPTISPTVAEEDEVHSIIASSHESTNAFQPPSIVSYMGDVNVQFPDNLLWKRRTLCLDSQGFLILSTIHGAPAATAMMSVLGSDHPAGTRKRYHLSDFRAPYIPEMEVQELPNSVRLDFVDGSGLQFACEDRPSQIDVLKILQAAHMSQATFGQ